MTKRARGAASAQRRAEREASQRRADYRRRFRRIALAAVKATIRDRGDKLSRWLARTAAGTGRCDDRSVAVVSVVQAKARIAERNLERFAQRAKA